MIDGNRSLILDQRIDFSGTAVRFHSLFIWFIKTMKLHKQERKAILEGKTNRAILNASELVLSRTTTTEIVAPQKSNMSVALLNNVQR